MGKVPVMTFPIFDIQTPASPLVFSIDPLTDGREHCELGEFGGKDFWVDGVGTKLKSTNRILTYFPGQSRCRRM